MMKFKRLFFLIVLILGLLTVTALGSSAETLFYKGSFNANGNCAYYGTFPPDTTAVYMAVNLGLDDEQLGIGLLFSDDGTELRLQSGSTVFRFTNGYWITSRNYQCWTELGVVPVTISLSTTPLIDIDFGDANSQYTDSISPLLQWAFGDSFVLYSISELEIVLTDVNVFEFVTLLFTPKVLLSVVYYLGFSLICCTVLGFIPLLFLFIWKFLISAFLGRKRWFKK